MEQIIFEVEKQKALHYAEDVRQRQELYELRHSNDKKKEKLSFSKIAFIFMVTNCVIIELYALFTMFYFQDLSSLPALIAAIVGECITLCGYYVKSGKENTIGGIVYESAMKKLEHELDNNESVG